MKENGKKSISQNWHVFILNIWKTKYFKKNENMFIYIIVLLILFNNDRTTFSCYGATSTTLNLNINFIWQFSFFFIFLFFLFNTTILDSLIPVPNKRVKHTETILSTTAKMCFIVLWDQVSQGLQWDWTSTIVVGIWKQI